MCLSESEYSNVVTQHPAVRAGAATVCFPRIFVFPVKPSGSSDLSPLSHEEVTEGHQRSDWLLRLSCFAFLRGILWTVYNDCNENRSLIHFLNVGLYQDNFGRSVKTIFT